MQSISCGVLDLGLQAESIFEILFALYFLADANIFGIVKQGYLVGYVQLPYVHARIAGVFSKVNLCIAHALLYPKKVISFAHSIAGPNDIFIFARRQALRGPFRGILLALLTLIAQAQNDLL